MAAQLDTIPADLVDEIATHVADKDEYGMCNYCGWFAEYPMSHVSHGFGKCIYVQIAFETRVDEGELMCRKRNSKGAWNYC